MFFSQVNPQRLSNLEFKLSGISRLSADFLVLLAGATIIASLGLYQNSPAVIIGAMLIAPLMRPLLALSLASLTGDCRLLASSALTLLTGTLLTPVIAATIAVMLSTLELTPEIYSRTSPTIMDLLVAITAGAVGAYCQTSEKLSDTLAGVAIAVALVPPLSVVGFGIALNMPDVWSGALLLYLTNLVGITVAGSFVFLLMGYTPLRKARKGLVLSLAMTMLLAIPLGLSMRELLLRHQVTAKIRSALKEKTFTFRDVRLRDVAVTRLSQPVCCTATIQSSGQAVTSRQVRLVQEFLSRELGQATQFTLRIIPVTEMAAETNERQNGAPYLIQVSAEPEDSPGSADKQNKPAESSAMKCVATGNAVSQAVPEHGQAK